MGRARHEERRQPVAGYQIKMSQPQAGIGTEHTGERHDRAGKNCCGDAYAGPSRGRARQRRKRGENPEIHDGGEFEGKQRRLSGW